MNWMSLTRRGPIGLDMGSRWIKAVQLAGAPGAWRIAAASMMPRQDAAAPVTADEVARIAEVLGRQGFTGDSVIAAVPSEKLISGILDMPPRESGAPVDQIARAEMASMHRLEPGAFEMAWWELPSGGRGRESTRIMATACPHTAAEQWIGLLESGGFEAIALDTEATALARLCGATPQSRPEVMPVLDLGWRAARLVLLHEGTIVYERRLSEAGLAPLWKAIESELRVEPNIAEYLMSEVGLRRPIGETDADDAEELPQLDESHRVIREHFAPMCQEVQSSMAYLEHQYGETNQQGAILVGGGAMIPGLAEYLSGLMNVEVKAMAPSHCTVFGEGLRSLAGNAMLAAATGLAMHEAGWNNKIKGMLKATA